MSPSEIKLLLDQFNMTAISLLTKGMFAYFILIILKTTVENISAYFLFKSNPYISIGKEVIVNGFRGIITKITFGFIVITGSDNEIYVIRMKTWKNQKWIFISKKE